MKKNIEYPSSMYHEKEEGFFHRHPIIPSVNVYNALRLMSLGFRDADAVNCLNLNVKYQELINDAAMFAKAFRELGVKKGDIITISLTNVYQAIAAFFAANSFGAVVTFLNSQSTIEQEENYLNEFESPLFIHMNKGSQYDGKIFESTKVQNIISLDEKDIESRNYNSGVNNGYRNTINFKEMAHIASYRKKLDFQYVGGSDDALILFTSGTTGVPKSVVITNKNIMASGIYMKNSCSLSVKAGEKSLVCVPFTYPYGFCTSTLMSLLIGREAILAPTLCNGNISYYYSKNPNYVFGSPAFLELTKRNIPKNQDLSSVHFFISGGDFLFDKQISDAIVFFKEHGSDDIEICNGSGNAESTGASTNSVGVPYKKGTVGKVLVGTGSIIITPDTKEELKYGEEGELCISGKHVFREYYHEPELTNEAKFMYNGKEYLHTGTIGILDSEGYFQLTGRVSRFYINSDLNKVYLERVQNIISLIDGVESCIAVPKPDDEKLYTCKAYIVPSFGIVPDEAFINYLKEQFTLPRTDVNGKEVQLKPYEIPSSFDFIETLPRRDDKGGKIDISLLENKAKEEYEIEKNETIKLNLIK